jgi:hypothetical protein
MPANYRGLTYPILYRYRPRSDRDWIFQRMSIIAPANQYDVASEYERIFMSDGRDFANTYLNELYLGCKNA